ncbi:MAG TPA: helix-turn-helix transcriptional regulator [Symbiobacteriaceae bacterium]
MELHDDSYRRAAERCGLDHTTLARVARGDTENPETLEKIASGYGVSLVWMRGERDVAIDFAFAVLAWPLVDRAWFMHKPEWRTAYGMEFLRQYDPERYTMGRLGELLDLPEAEVEILLSGEHGLVSRSNFRKLCTDSGLPIKWFQAGVLDCENEEELLVEMAAQALSNLAKRLGANVTSEEIQVAARALV